MKGLRLFLTTLFLFAGLLGCNITEPVEDIPNVNPNIVSSRSSQTTTGKGENMVTGEKYSTPQKTNSSETLSSPESTKPNDGKSVASQELKVYFLDVGQADSILIQTPGKKVMLIDGGNNSDGNEVLRFIKAQGIRKIDVLVGTHPHEDHIGGLDDVIKGLDIGEIYMPKVSTTTKTFEDVLLAIKDKKLKVKTAFGGESVEIDPNIKVEMFSPNSNTYAELNDYSPVIKLTYKDTSFLFTGDAESLSEQEILNKGYNVKADVLKVGHHGSSSSTSPKFLKAVSPKHGVISVGKDNKYGHPDGLILNRLKSFGVKTYRTDTQGSIIFSSDGSKLSVNYDKSILTGISSPSNDKNTIAGNVSSQKNSGKDIIKAENTKVVSIASGTTNDNVTNSNEGKSIESLVYITKTGSKYHSEGCKYLSKSQIPISLSDAIKGGYDPCKVCKPPR